MLSLASWFGFESRLAVRFLYEGRVQTLLIIVGVAAGVAVVTYISALIAGLQNNTLNKTLGAQAHITLKPLDDAVAAARLPDLLDAQTLVFSQPRSQRPRSIANWQQVVSALESMHGVTAVSPMVSAAGLGLRGDGSRAVVLMGIELERYDRIVQLRSKVVAGRAQLGPGEAIIGRELAEDLGLNVGDRLNLVLGGGASAVNESLRITALVDLGVRDLNRRTVLLPLRSAQSLVGLPGGATSLDVTLVNVWAAQDMAQQLSSRWPYKVESWQEANSQLVSALNAQSVSTTLIRSVVMVVVILGIASVLVVSVVQKRREIGILRAMGATRGQIWRIFLMQGALVGALGSVLGVILAIGLIWAFTHFVRGADGSPLFSISLEPLLAIKIALAATTCGVLAAVAPARRAAALDPAQAIRA